MKSFLAQASGLTPPTLLLVVLTACVTLPGAGCTEDSTRERAPRPAPQWNPRPQVPASTRGRITVAPRRTGDKRTDRFIKEYLEAVTGRGKEQELWDSLRASMSTAAHKYPVDTYSQVHYTTLDKRKVTMDIFVPQKTKKKPPLLVWFPGGGFVMYLLGFPSGGLIAGNHGYAVAYVFYNLSTSSTGPFPAGRRSWPQALIASKRALRYLRDNATKYGYDASKIVVGGFSAGGAMASYLGATSGQNLLEAGPKSDPQTAVHGVWISSAVSNLAYFDPKDPNVTAKKNKWGKLFWAITFYLGQWAETPQAQWAIKQANPMGHVSSAAANIYWIMSHGDADPVVPYDQSTAMRDKLLSVGARVRLYRHKGEGHHLSTVQLSRLVHIMTLVNGP